MRILIVDDDVELCNAIVYHLEREGYNTDVCHNGGDAMHFIEQQAYQLILLDRMLPEQSGMDILAQIRSLGMNVPVIITTALNALGDRIIGLDAGADDYLTKPFAMEELLARIRAVTRRPAQLWNSRKLTFSDIELDAKNATLSCNGISRTLSKRETELMEIFIETPQNTLARSLLLARVWGADAPVEDGNLDNYIHFLRRHLKALNSKVKIQTVRSMGYALQED